MLGLLGAAFRLGLDLDCCEGCRFVVLCLQLASAVFVVGCFV